MTKELNIYWENSCIGKIINPKFDNFDLYGDWHPENGVVYDKFLSCLERDEQLEIIIGEGDEPFKGTVEIEPDDEIEIKMRPSV